MGGMEEVLKELAKGAGEALEFALAQGAAVVVEIPAEPPVEELMERELPRRGTDLRNAFKDGLIYLLAEGKEGVMVYLADGWGRREKLTFPSRRAALEWLWRERGARVLEEWRDLILWR